MISCSCRSTFTLHTNPPEHHHHHNHHWLTIVSSAPKLWVATLWAKEIHMLLGHRWAQALTAGGQCLFLASCKISYFTGAAVWFYFHPDQPHLCFCLSSSEKITSWINYCSSSNSSVIWYLLPWLQHWLLLLGIFSLTACISVTFPQILNTSQVAEQKMDSSHILCNFYKLLFLLYFQIVGGNLVCPKLK